MTAAIRRPGPRALWTFLWTAVAAALLAVPTLQQAYDFPLYNLIYLYFVFFWVTQATSWNIFSGYSGYFSFGQGAFYGAGLYVTAILAERHGYPLLPALPIAGLVGGLIAVLTGVVVFRLRRLSGEIFALFTLAVALGLGGLANNWSFIDGGRGIPIGSIEYPDWLGSTTEMLYYLGLVLAIVSVALAAFIQRSRLGFGLSAIRDDERVAETLGVPTFRYKIGVFALTGVIAAVSGALHAVQVNFISPGTAFGIEIPLFVILMSVVGGRRHWAGPVVGAVLIYTVSDRLTGAGLAELSQVLLAVVLIAATLFLRGGIVPRLLQRPVPAVAAGAAALLVQIAAVDAPMITKAAVSMLVAMVVLFVPERAYERLPRPWRRPRPRAGEEAAAGPPASTGAATDAAPAPGPSGRRRLR